MGSDKKSRKAQHEIKESAQKIWLAGLGALTVAEQEGAKMFDALVERGREWEGRSRERMEKARSRVGHAVDDVESRVDERVSAALHRFGVPTRDEIHELTSRVEELNAQIEKLNLAKAKAKGGTKPKPTGVGKARKTA
jgi:poly(hydroxyalkanoate) granule-associated protein